MRHEIRSKSTDYFCFFSLANWVGNSGCWGIDATCVQQLCQFRRRYLVFGVNIDDGHRWRHFLCLILGMLRSYSGESMHDSQCKLLSICCRYNPDLLRNNNNDHHSFSRSLLFVFSQLSYSKLASVLLDL